MRGAFLAAALFVLAACGGKVEVIDGSSKEAAEQSIATLSAALPPDKKAEFEAAIDMGWPLSQIAGKTPDEVIALARAKLDNELVDRNEDAKGKEDRARHEASREASDTEQV